MTDAYIRSVYVILTYVKDIHLFSISLYISSKHTRKENNGHGSAVTTLRSKRTSDGSINGTPLMPRAAPMTKIETQYYSIEEEKT
jgi:hypothetical protein